jgi:hypothetical protein
VSPYVRTVKTASGATAVQIVHSSRRGSRDIEHIGSAHDDAELELLKVVAQQRMAGDQAELDLGADLVPGKPAAGAPLPITSSRMGHLWDALSHAYDRLGFAAAAKQDEVFRQLVLARIIEPTSKLDSLRVLEEVGVAPASYPTINRRLPVYAKDEWRDELSKVCASRARLGPASLVLYDVSTLYFETDTGDGFREPGFSKERRLEPQITIGLLTDASGFPLLVDAFEGNKAETTTMIPTVQAFMKAYNLPEVTVVADAGMVSAGNQQALEVAGLSFILGARVPDLPYAVRAWQEKHPGEAFEDGQVFVQQWPAGPTDHRRDQMIYYQYRADRARRTLRGIDTQVAKAEKAVEGKTEIKRNRFVKLSGGTRTVNRGPGGENPVPGRDQRICDQPGRLPRRHPGHGGLRDRRLPPALRDRKVLPDVQTRPPSPAHLQPDPRLHRRPPGRRVCRPGHRPLDRRRHRLVHPEVRQDRPPLPRDHHPSRRPHHHRRRPPTRRPPPSPRRDPLRPRGRAALS